MHYSTFDGTAMAWEGYHYWRDWADYLNAPAHESVSRLVETGCLVMKSEENGFLERHMKNSLELNCPHEDWSTDTISKRLPIYNLQSFTPARTMDDPAFGQSNGCSIKGGVYWPNAGYVTDPALSAQNLTDAASRVGGEFYLGIEVVEILTQSGRVKGIKLSTGEEIHAPICLLYTSPSPRDATLSRMPSSA